MKLLVLGGSNVQYNLVKKAKAKGHTVIISDYYEDAPAKSICDIKELASTFDVEANMAVAQKYSIDGITTLGTDQPVYTVAKIAEKFKLPALIDVETAKAATNKKVMKGIFKANNLPTANYRIIKKGFEDDELSEMRFPVVVKPLDSQGQRGVYKLDSVEAVRNYFDDVICFSRENEILVEEYYESEEITISGWVAEGRTYILTITDRLSYKNFPHIGICTAHRFPSKHFIECGNKIISLAEAIVKDFHIKNGPIYFQMLIGDEGIKINEIACRIGGAYEDEFIPFLTGVDILDMLIMASFGQKINYQPLRSYNIWDNKKHLSVEMLFAGTGRIKVMNDMDEIKKLPGVLQAKYNFKPGHKLQKIENATARAGYMIIAGENEKALEQNIMNAYEKLYINDENDRNIIIK